MKFIFAYNKENGEVAFYSTGGECQTAKFSQIELYVTDEQYEKMQMNYKMWIKDGELKLEKTDHILLAEKKEKTEEIKRIYREKLKNPHVKFEDVKDLFIQLLE